MDFSTLGYIALISLLFSAFFSGLEFAFISANRIKIEIRKQRGGIIGRTLERYYESPNQFLGTTLTGNNIALVVYTWALAELLRPFLQTWLGHTEWIVLLANTLVSTLIILVFGEFLPKSIFRFHPSGVLQLVALPFLLIYALLYPFVAMVVKLANTIFTYIFGVDAYNEQTVLGYVDLQHYIHQQANTSTTHDDIDAQMLEKVMDLPDLQVRDCMIHRINIEGVPEDASFEEVRQRFISTKHSKLIVYKESVDLIVGYYHHLGVLQEDLQVWEMMEVPETMPIADLLETFIRENRSIARVVDEFGGTAGIVTLEDIIEEVIGEIHDEHDVQLLQEKIDNNNYKFDARLEIKYLNEQYDLELEEGDYDTLGGYMLYLSGEIPKPNKSIKTEKYHFYIEAAQPRKVEIVKVHIIDF